MGTWQGLKDDYRTYCGLICFPEDELRDESYLKWRDGSFAYTLKTFSGSAEPG